MDYFKIKDGEAYKDLEQAIEEANDKLARQEVALGFRDDTDLGDRIDEAYTYAELLADYALKSAAKHYLDMSQDEGIRVNAASGKILLNIEQLPKKSVNFLNDHEREIVEDFFVNIIRESLQDPFLESFEKQYYDYKHPRVIGEKEAEMGALRKDYAKQREELRRQLQSTQEQKDNRPNLVLEYGRVVTLEQIYEATRQFEQINRDELEEGLEGMFNHLVTTWYTIKQRSMMSGGYLTTNEADLIIEEGQKVVAEFYKSHPQKELYLKIFDKVFKNAFDDSEGRDDE